MIEELLQRIKDLEDRVAALNEENFALKDKISKLEFRLNKNSSNSSKPPSSDPPWMPRRKDGAPGNGKRGGQPGRNGSYRKLLSEEKVDEVIRCMPANVCSCGGDVSIDHEDYERRQVFEIPNISPIVIEYQLVKGSCRDCYKNSRGSLPPGAPSGMLGPNALATIGLLTGKFHLSKRDVQELFSDYFSLDISLGTVSNAEQQVSASIKKSYEELARSIKSEEVVGMDETGHKIAGKLGYMWVALTGFIAVFFARDSRKKSVAQEILGEKFSGTLISDRYQGYLWVTNRQLCWAHLIRNFQELEDAGGEAKDFATPVLDFIKEMFCLWHQYRDQEISRIELQEQSKPIREKIEEALYHGQQILLPGALCRSLCNLKSSLWTFIELENVEPTNNDSERAIRQYVVWRKTSFGTQTSKGNEFVERILTVVATCKKQKRRVFEYLATATAAHLTKKDSPSLLPN